MTSNSKEYERERYYKNREKRLAYAREYQKRPYVRARIRAWQKKRNDEIRQKGIENTYG